MTDKVLMALIALSRARQAVFPEEDQRVYLRVLANKRLPETDIIAACGELAGEPRADFASPMPTAGDLVKRAEAIAAKLRVAAHNQKLIASTGGDEDPRSRYRCVTCFDTGWAIRQCPGAERAHCGRSHKDGWYEVNGRTYYNAPCHGPHTYAEPCVCPASPGQYRRSA